MKLADQQILGLTVHRPWSELVAAGLKTIECRSWLPHKEHLGRFIAVHASTRWDQEGAEHIGRNHHRFLVEQPRPDACEAGVIAVARLVGWVERVELGERGPTVLQMLPGFAFEENDWRWFHQNKYGWVLRSITRIKPVAVKGRQGLWVLPQLVLESVRSRWRQATLAKATQSSAPRTAGT